MWASFAAVTSASVTRAWPSGGWAGCGCSGDPQTGQGTPSASAVASAAAWSERCWSSRATQVAWASSASPRATAYARWYVREPGFKLNERGEVFDMSDAPFVEQLVEPGSETAAGRAARTRLAAALKELNPAGGITVPPGQREPGKKGGKKKKTAQGGI